MSVAAQQLPSAGSILLDHVSHFVPDLAEAARALAALGFTVTPPSAQHTQDGPAGTANVCVMLAQGYLEFLAPDTGTPNSDTPNAQRLRTSMQRYPGVHLACFGTPDAEGEQQRLRVHDFSPQPLVKLERKVDHQHHASFSVVRAAPEKMPEGRIQFVQHHTAQALWRPQYLGHPNQAVKLACVFVVADDPVVTAVRWARFAALLPRPVGAFVHLPTARGQVLIGRREHWGALLGDAPAAPALAGYALECQDPTNLISRCQLLGLALRKLRKNLYAVSLPAALGGSCLVGTKQALALG